PFFPGINKPSDLSEFDEMGEFAIIYHIFAPIGCLLLFILVIRTAGGRKKKTAAQKTASRQKS
ncbi:MAG: zinc ribbon domain-containing protein, partial [Eubacteriales bacterium]|nr:zinc ribbon domain-containing protein [Eubacteriales bacterium]